MRITIDRESSVPLREQIAAQLVFLIGIGDLRPGDDLPSVRQLARTLRVHHNPVSQAYRDPMLEALVERTRGRKLTVGMHRSPAPGRSDLDEIIDTALAAADEIGSSAHDLLSRLECRLHEVPPSRVLVVSKRPGIRLLSSVEVRQRLGVPVEACSPDELAADPRRATGALVLSSPGALPQVERVLPVEHPLIRIRYAPPDPEIERIRALLEPSVIVIASVSRYFLEIARDVLASVVGRRHTLVDRLMSQSRSRVPRSADLVICDSIAFRVLKPVDSKSRVLHHPLISMDCLEEIESSLVRAGVRPALSSARRLT